MAVNLVKKELGNYYLEIINIIDFKEYYNDNLGKFNAFSSNAFLKAVDIPPKFFKEQPLKTQEDLIENRDVFVKETKKFFDKVIVILRDPETEEILNACRLKRTDANLNYERLKPLDSLEVEGKFEHRTFMKDGYASILISKNLKKNEENNVLVIDFPLLMNKKVIIHKALYKMPTEDSLVPVDHIRYLTNDEIDLEGTYNDINDALLDFLPFLNDTESTSPESENILEEAQVVSLALVADEIIPKSYVGKIGKYIEDNSSESTLTTEKLESLVLDFDRDIKSYKQVTNLRNVSGLKVLEILKSDDFLELKNIMQEQEDNSLL